MLKLPYNPIFFFSYKKYNKTLKKHFKIPIQNLFKGTDII